MWRLQCDSYSNLSGLIRQLAADKTEFDLLLDQIIIAPVTEVTDWCALIIMTPKKVQIASECVSIYLVLINM